MSETVPTETVTPTAPEAPALSAAAPLPFWRRTLRGFSQCAFQADEITALFFIAAATVFDWQMGAFYVIAVVVGTATAVVLRADRALLDLGLFGFNSGLMGLALGNFFHPNTALWIAVVVLAALVAALTVVMARWFPLPFLAGPFIATFWVVWPATAALNLEPVSFAAFAQAEPAFVVATADALGSTLFAAAVLPGLLFLAGLLIGNWRHAVVAVIAAVVAVALAVHVGAPGEAINSGFVGFNAVLAGLAVWVLVGQDLRLVVLAALVATWFFSAINRTAPFPALASGFVLTIWALILIDRINPWFRGEAGDTAPDRA
jgi:urea transporter